MTSAQGIFSSIASAFGGGKSGRSVLGVDIGSSTIKLVQLRPQKGSAILETYGEIALGPYAGVAVGKATKLSVDKIGEAVIDLMKESNVTATQAGVSIPFSSSLISILHLPQVEEEQLKRMIPIEARKYIPVPISEVLLDWFVIPEDEKEPDAFDRIQKEVIPQKRGREVLLAAIHNETIHAYQTIMETAKLSVSFFEIEIFSAIRSSLGHGVVPVVIVDMGASTTKIYVVERGVVRFSHLLNVGGQHTTESLSRALEWTFDKSERMKRESGLNDSQAYTHVENSLMHQTIQSGLTRVFAEINRVILSYGKKYNREVSHVVFTGGGAALPGLDRAAHEALHVDVESAHPFGKVEAPAFLEDVLRSIGPSFAVAAGAALRKLSQDA